MAATLRKTRQDEVRAKIKVSQILNRVQSHLNGEVELSGTQMKAAELLLRKALPDLTSVEITGVDGGPVKMDSTLSPSDAYLKMIGKK